MSGPEEHIEGERVVSPAASGRPGMSRWQKIAIFGLGTGAIISAVFWRDAGRHHEEPHAEPAQMGQATPFERYVAPPAAIPVAMVSQAPMPSYVQAFHEAAQRPTGKDVPAKRMLSYASAAPMRTEAAAAPAAPERTGVAFKASRIPGGKAGPAMDLTYMLMPGVVKCVLNNAIDTTQPGPIFCHTSEDIYSPQHVRLMEKGTQIVGSYTSNMQQGQTRLPAVSAFAITPNGVTVALASPMGDALGRAGFAGEVDTHFMSKFGGALLLMASQGAIGAAQATLQHGNGNSYLNLQSGGVESTVSEVLRNTVNIPPTVTVNQGSEVAFLVTQPIDFRDAYELRTVP